MPPDLTEPPPVPFYLENRTFFSPNRPSSMTLSLKRTHDALHFRGTNGSFSLPIASSDAQEGLTPMEMTALSVLGCSSIDILTILNKQKQEVDDFSADIDAERAEGAPRVFTDLLMHYELTGDVTPDKVRRAIELSLDKYCSVSNMVKHTATITYAFTVNGERYEQDQ
jgi:putative redox protein